MKGKADHLTISGMSGGTGAAKWGSIKHCGNLAAGSSEKLWEAVGSCDQSIMGTMMATATEYLSIP